MKLIVAGATGFVAKEIIRQSLHNPKITSVLAVARRQVSPPPNLGERADTSKLHSVTLNDYGHWPDDVERQLAGADACIWYFYPAKSTLPVFSPGSTPPLQSVPNTCLPSSI